MHILKTIAHAAIRICKQTWSVPKSLFSGFKHLREQPGLEEREEERLDRIRNPSKYLGLVNTPEVIKTPLDNSTMKNKNHER
jgi:hypothetical protein